jgi:hypothetical protein
MRAWQCRPRGHAKTADLAISCTWAILFAPRAIKGIAAAGDKEQAKLLRDGVETLVRCNPWMAPMLDVQGHAVINRRTGSRLDILSSDVATSFGQLADFIVCDEVTHWPEGRGEQLWVSLLSTAAKRDRCLLLCGLNAGFLEHFAGKLHERIRTDARWHFSNLDGPQASWITAERLAEQESLLPPISFRRLWLNEFSSGSGDAIDASDIEHALAEGIQPMAKAMSGMAFFGAIDLATSRDVCSVVVIGRQGRGLLRLAQVKAWKPPKGSKLSLQMVQNQVLELHRLFRPHFYYDRWQCELMAEQLRALGVRMTPVQFSGRDAQAMASETVAAFSERRIQLYRDEALLADLRSLRIVESPSGWRLTAPRTASGHADRGVGLAMAILASKRHPGYPGSQHPGYAPCQAIAGFGGYSVSESSGFPAPVRSSPGFRSI